jgi:hypothetical protein
VVLCCIAEYMWWLQASVSCRQHHCMLACLQVRYDPGHTSFHFVQNLHLPWIFLFAMFTPVL